MGWELDAFWTYLELSKQLFLSWRRKTKKRQLLRQRSADHARLLAPKRLARPPPHRAPMRLIQNGLLIDLHRIRQKAKGANGRESPN